MEEVKEVKEAVEAKVKVVEEKVVEKVVETENN